MTENNNNSEYITFPRSFEKYKWYKPILVFILTLIIFLVLSIVLTLVFKTIYGDDLISKLMTGGYEILDTEMGQIFTDLGVIILIPSLYLSTKIVKDRPFSSYSCLILVAFFPFIF